MTKLIKILKRRRRSQRYKPVILVTGCSSGIGLALARRLWTMYDYRVVVTVRPNSLGKLKDEKFRDTERFWIQHLEVTSNEDRKRLVDEVIQKWGKIDILINNAGISFRAVVEHMDSETERLQLETNYLGPMGLIRLVLPSMRISGRGKIINVSSVSGMLAMPTMASYSASKHALEGASEALWYEMRPLGINVTLIQPGFIRSSSFRNVVYSAQSALSQAAGGPYSDYYRYMTPFISKMMQKSGTTPEKVARIILNVIRTENPPLRVPASFDAFLFFYIRRFFPRRFFHPFLFFCLPGSGKWGERYSQKRD